jgi:diguanylate cyclase (GGDEF)-like protein
VAREGIVHKSGGHFVLEAYRHWLHNTLAGMLISIGAPLGLLLLRTLVLRLDSPSSIWRDISSNSLVYVYVSATTMLAFALFGYVLGQQADELQKLSATDGLTGVYNRRALSAYLEHEFSRSIRYRSPLSLLLVDVDELKRVNDVHGHAAGDQVIRAFARAITVTLRDADIGGRWGGDEFLIIAPSTLGAAAATLAERLQCELATQQTSDEATATASVGAATFDPNHQRLEDLDAILHKADAALHRAKAAGRNQVRVA